MFEVWNVLTYRDYDFEDGGRIVKGRTLHCYRTNKADGWPGVEYAKLSVPFGSEAFSVIPVIGKNYEMYFDRRGKIARMVQCDPKG